MKVVSHMLRHSSITITADTYTSVLPETARQAAEAAVAIVPRAAALSQPDDAGPSSPVPHGPGYDAGLLLRGEEAQVRCCAPPGTRTPNPRIKSPLLCQLS